MCWTTFSKQQQRTDSWSWDDLTKRQEKARETEKLSAIAMRLPLVTLAILPAYTLAQSSRHRYGRTGNTFCELPDCCRYQFRRQDEGTLHGEFVDYPADVEQVEQGRQADRDSEPVPVVIKGKLFAAIFTPPTENRDDKNAFHRTSSSSSSLFWPTREQQWWSKQASLQFWQRHHHEPGWSWLCPLPPALRSLLP